MTATQIIIAAVVGLVGVSIVWAVSGLGLPKTYRERKCAGNEWRSQFPTARKEEIRLFLSVFTEAFAIRERDKLKFRPSDKLLEIRDKLNPVKGIDALELETLSKLLKNIWIASKKWEYKLYGSCLSTLLAKLTGKDY